MGKNEKKERTVRLPNFFEAIIPIVVMMALMLYGFVGGSGYSDAHMPLLVSIVVACIIAVSADTASPTCWLVCWTG